VRQLEATVTMASGSDHPLPEQGKLERSPPGVSGLQRAPTGSGPSRATRDSALGDGLTTLVSALEQLTMKLSDTPCQQNPTAALEVLTDMVEYAVSFAEHLARLGFATPTLEHALRKAGTRDPSQSYLEARGNRLGDQVMLLYTQWPGRDEQRASAFRGIAENLIEVVEFYLAAFTLQFRSSSLADQWGDVNTTLMADTFRAIEGICF
jgi:hypothetical protein